MFDETSVVLAHAGGWDELLVLAIPVLVFLGMRWWERQKERGRRRDEGPPT